MALLSTYQKFKEKNAQGNQGGQSEPQKQETQKENSGSGLMSTYQQFMSKKQGGTQAVNKQEMFGEIVYDDESTCRYTITEQPSSEDAYYKNLL